MKKSYIVAIAFCLILVLWMVSGLFIEQEQQEEQRRDTQDIFSVEVELRKAQPTPVYLTVQGQTVPNREIQIKALTQSIIDEILVQEGRKVDSGTTIVTLDKQTREADLQQQEALLEARVKNLERLQLLAKQQYQSDSEIEQAIANVKASQAAIERIKLDLQFITPKSPISGYIQKLHVEKGDLVKVGDAIATVIESDPLVIEAQLAQQDIQKIEIGSTAQIRLGTGQETAAKVRFIAPKAEADSRTFLVELESQNPDGELRTGTSASVKLLTSEQTSHYLSPALFSLNSNGDIGVKTASKTGIVEFHQVNIIQSDENGAWVTGLPNEARVIVTGQGFVEAGSKVNPVMRGDR